MHELALGKSLYLVIRKLYLQKESRDIAVYLHESFAESGLKGSVPGVVFTCTQIEAHSKHTMFQVLIKVELCH